LKAELLLHHSGDFLVRESAKIPGQFILSGRYQDHFKHLLLVDPEGVVNTPEEKKEEIIVFFLCYRFVQKIMNLIQFNI